MTPTERAILDDLRAEIHAAMDRAEARLRDVGADDDHLDHRGHWDACGTGDWHCSEHCACACLPATG
jgi:hypothetical protein